MVGNRQIQTAEYDNMAAERWIVYAPPPLDPHAALPEDAAARWPSYTAKQVRPLALYMIKSYKCVCIVKAKQREVPVGCGIRHVVCVRPHLPLHGQACLGIPVKHSGGEAAAPCVFSSYV